MCSNLRVRFTKVTICLFLLLFINFVVGSSLAAQDAYAVVTLRNGETEVIEYFDLEMNWCFNEIREEMTCEVYEFISMADIKEIYVGSLGTNNCGVSPREERLFNVHFLNGDSVYGFIDTMADSIWDMGQDPMELTGLREIPVQPKKSFP